MAMQLGLMTVAGWGGTGYYEFAARAAARAGPRRASAAVRSGHTTRPKFKFKKTNTTLAHYTIQVQENKHHISSLVQVQENKHHISSLHNTRRQLPS
jgi:hypothetical protein